MNAYMLKRLFPFYLCAIIAEIAFTIFSIATANTIPELSFSIIVKGLGILLLTTTSAFLIMMLPYVAYIILLPRRFQNSGFDKITSLIFFALYATATYGEEIISAKFGEGYFARHNLNWGDTLISLSSQSALLCLLICIIGGSCALSRRYLVPNDESPRLFNRIFQGLIYGLVCLLTYNNINPDTLNIAPDQYTNHLASEGTYDLIKNSTSDYQHLIDIND